ncbi:MAG: DUF5666 domain-containing protein [Woeseia sp.]
MKVRSSRLGTSIGRFSLACLAALVTGCSGDSSNSEPDVGSGPIGGIDGGGRLFASGPINSFGSVIVNGVTYDTSGAEIIADDQVVTESALKVGQIVLISATSDGTTLSADRIVYDDNLEGPIESIDVAGNVLTVLGQTVRVNSVTSFDSDIPGRTLEGLSIGEIVEISGYVNSSQEIVATRIELEDDQGDYEVTGIVANLDSVAMTFSINNLVVDYSQASLDDFDSGQISNGDLVEVEGDQFGNNGELIADSVELEDDIRDNDDIEDSDVEIEGLITRFVSATDFDVSGIPVTTNGNTQYDDGTDADLALDVLVEVDGRFNSDGVLVADEIDFEEIGRLEIEALVDNVDTAAGRVTLLGITVEINDETRMEDDTDAMVRPFSINNINVGDWLEVKGYEEEPGSNLLTATRVERDDADDEASIQGFATDVANPSFRILGLAIDTDGNTEFDDISASEFFATAEGRLVEVDGNLNGVRFLATEVEFEEED